MLRNELHKVAKKIAERIKAIDKKGLLLPFPG